MIVLIPDAPLSIIWDVDSFNSREGVLTEIGDCVRRIKPDWSDQSELGTIELAKAKAMIAENAAVGVWVKRRTSSSASYRARINPFHNFTCYSAYTTYGPENRVYHDVNFEPGSGFRLQTSGGVRKKPDERTEPVTYWLAAIIPMPTGVMMATGTSTTTAGKFAFMMDLGAVKFSKAKLLVDELTSKKLEGESKIQGKYAGLKAQLMSEADAWLSAHCPFGVVCSPTPYCIGSGADNKLYAGVPDTPHVDKPTGYAYISHSVINFPAWNVSAELPGSVLHDSAFGVDGQNLDWLGNDYQGGQFLRLMSCALTPRFEEFTSLHKKMGDWYGAIISASRNPVTYGWTGLTAAQFTADKARETNRRKQLSSHDPIVLTDEQIAEGDNLTLTDSAVSHQAYAGWSGAEAALKPTTLTDFYVWFTNQVYQRCK